MKQEHEMTPGVLVSGEVLSAGDARARVAVLEAEVAELRKRVCVPDGWRVVPVEATRAILDAIDLLCDDHTAFDDSDAFWRFLLAAAPAPVERVEQGVASEARRIADKWLSMSVVGSTHISYDDVTVMAKAITTPQPAAPAAQDVAWLVEALQSVEWVWSDGSPTKEPDYYCPSCDQPMHQGHSDDCELGSCIATHQSGGVK